MSGENNGKAVLQDVFAKPNWPKELLEIRDEMLRKIRLADALDDAEVCADNACQAAMEKAEQAARILNNAKDSAIKARNDAQLAIQLLIEELSKHFSNG